MQAANVPAKFNIPFASSAGGSFIRTVPQASQIGIQDGAASLTDGFPPLTMNPVGTPPFGQDMNGILFESTSWDRWFSAGGPVKYDATFSTAIGGYPKGAVVASATIFGYFWLCAADDNTTDPDAGGANWSGFALGPSGSAVAGSFKKLAIINGGTPANQMTITADQLVVESTAGVAVRLSTVSVTPDITVSGVNGLDTGTVAAATWYAEWVIFNPTTATVAGLFSLSATAPTMPAGYTFKARVGWARTAAAAATLLNITQSGRIAQYVVGSAPANTVNIANGTAGTYSSASPTLVTASVAGIVPPTASRIHIVATDNYKNLGGSGADLLAAPTAAWGGSQNGPTGTNGNIFPIWVLGVSGTNSGAAWINLETTSIAWCSSNAGGALGCMGWEDAL